MSRLRNRIMSEQRNPSRSPGGGRGRVDAPFRRNASTTCSVLLEWVFADRSSISSWQFPSTFKRRLDTRRERLATRLVRRGLPAWRCSLLSQWFRPTRDQTDLWDRPETPPCHRLTPLTATPPATSPFHRLSIQSHKFAPRRMTVPIRPLAEESRSALRLEQPMQCLHRNRIQHRD